MSVAPSFLFIVNEQPTNDDLEIEGSIQPRMVEGRYYPPEVSDGFLPQQPGYVFRWRSGSISPAPGYVWTEPYHTIYANSTTGVIYPTLYRAATVFYCNEFAKFFTARGDISTRDSTEPEDQWQPLTFFHENNHSYVSHAGDQGFLAVRRASWIEQLLPNDYRRHSRSESNDGGLSGLLPILIALVAFSCSGRDALYHALIDERAWRNHRWVPHGQETGRIERRGMVVSVYLDPENPADSTFNSVSGLENGPVPMFR